MIDTFYLHLEFKGTNGAWSINLPFLCSKCGVCCTLEDFLTAGEIKATTQEQPEVHSKIKALFEKLGAIWETDETKYNQYVAHHPCSFLVEKSCSIYEIRPDGCQQFPNTTFGMQTLDCEPLNRFKMQRAALKKAKAAAETYHFTSKSRGSVKCKSAIKPAKFTEKQYRTCIDKLRQAGASDEELALFKFFNERVSYA